MEYHDYYQILGVERNANQEDIKRAYRRLARQFHPDVNPDNPAAEERFKKINEAYQVLSDPQKRRRYDQFGHEGLQGTGFRGFSGFEDIFSSFGDIFEGFFGFGNRGGRTRARQGKSLRYDVSLTLEQAFRGVEQEISFHRLEACPACGGTGAAPGSEPRTCPTCQGRGQVVRSQGFFQVASTCPACHGQGEIITDPCQDCRGGGKVRVERTVSVKIPAGVDTGSQLRLAGEGEKGRNGGPPGDLYVVIRVRPHDVFEREGADIYLEVPVSYATLVLGGEIEVPTLDGKAKLKIPPGTDSGTVFRLRGKGLPIRGIPLEQLEKLAGRL